MSTIGTQPTAAPASGSSPPSAGARIHIVQSGESLSLIATRILGPNASSAKVAALTQELWQLNAARIGTGDPDLIRTGQQLVLPGR